MVGPDVPLSSLYRIIGDLVAAGVLIRLEFAEGFARFELDEELAEHHHHLVCTECGDRRRSRAPRPGAHHRGPPRSTSAGAPGSTPAPTASTSSGCAPPVASWQAGVEGVEHRPDRARAGVGARRWARSGSGRAPRSRAASRRRASSASTRGRVPLSATPMPTRSDVPPARTWSAMIVAAWSRSAAWPTARMAPPARVRTGMRRRIGTGDAASASGRQPAAGPGQVEGAHHEDVAHQAAHPLGGGHHVVDGGAGGERPPPPPRRRRRRRRRRCRCRRCGRARASRRRPGGRS